MEFVRLEEKEYRKFYNHFPQASFMQSFELGELKKEFGQVVHLVGIKDKGKLIAASLVLEQNTRFKKKRFYAPRGLMVDYHHFEVLEFFVTELKKYIKEHNGFMLTIDPNVIYRTRSSDGEIISTEKDDLAIQNLLELGFTHHGFNLYLDALQARWAYRLKLDEPYEVKKSKFSKSTRKNIDATFKKGLQVRTGTIEDLEVMTEIFDITAKRRDFFSQSFSYYQKMYQHMKDLMTIYIAYLDPDVYYEHTRSLVAEEEKKNREIEKKMEKDHVGSKLLNQKETSDQLLAKYRKELEKAEQFRKDNPNGKAIGCLLSVRSGNEYLTLSSGALEEYHSFTPKYAMYEKHIMDAYQEGFEYCNFYGITGDFRPGNRYYGIYEFKKGFAGNVIEYIGEFELGITKFYSIYRRLRSLKDKIRK